MDQTESTPSSPEAEEKKSATPAKKSPAKKEAAKPARRRFEHSYEPSDPFLTQTVVLNSRHSIDIYSRTYDRCASSIFVISIVIRARGTEAQALEYGVLADQQLDKYLKELSDEGRRIAKVAESAGIEGSPAYSKPAGIEVPITSPRVMRYLNIIRQFDELMGQMDMLWLSGAMTDDDYYKSVHRLKLRLLRVSNEISRIATRARKAVTRSDNVKLQATLKQISEEMDGNSQEDDNGSDPDPSASPTESEAIPA